MSLIQYASAETFSEESGHLTNALCLQQSAHLTIRREHVWYQMRGPVTLFINIAGMSEKIALSHGSGGRQTHELIRSIFARHFGMQEPMTDSALLTVPSEMIAFTTDSYVVNPIFFPGGNIGKLAICGTVNDLAVSGADPKYIAASFIIEEGFEISDLDKIAASMADEAETAGVKIVTGDTKVVEKGHCDRIFITTTGVGILRNDHSHISSGAHITAGDRLIINGPPGNHEVTIIASRKQLTFDVPLTSDCASLNHMIKKVLEQSSGVHFMRDLTRGGLAAVLNELAGMTLCGITIDEDMVPVEEPVRGLCEILGFDPLTLASEGRVIIAAAADEAQKILKIMRSDPAGRDSSIIGEITVEKPGRVIVNSSTGGRRFLDMPSGLLLPRIC
jgi:hydrogenase expression/formation protein HypE